jgi:hypothetical protein
MVRGSSGGDEAVVGLTLPYKWHPGMECYAFVENEHPRANDGRFGDKAGAHDQKQLKSKQANSKPVGKQSGPAPSGMAAQAAQVVNGKLAPTKQRAFDGKPVAIKNGLSKQMAGAIGEQVCVQWLKSKGMKDAKSLSDHLSSARNNLPADLIQDHQIIEVKAGQASNGPGAQQWRLTIGEPGAKEKAWLAKASPEAKAKFNAKKQAAISARKKEAIANVSKELGYKVGGKTMTCIINHDTRTVDLYQFDGFHDRIGWNSSEAKAGYLGSVKYG